MIRGLFRLIGRLFVLGLLVFVGTAIWIVYDGLSDQGDRADVMVVPGMTVRPDGAPGPTLRTRLDGAVKLYREGKFPLIVVSGATRGDGYDEPKRMAQYLEAHQVPPGAIIEDREGSNTSGTAQGLARIMKQRNLHSVMIVTHYYHVTRVKLALRQAGITEIGQQHVGVVQKEDAVVLAREVIATYFYLAKYYLIPGAKDLEAKAKEEAPKVKDEIQKEADKLKQDLQKK
jgi:vancomycin permeability regulator SanA